MSTNTAEAVKAAGTPEMQILIMAAGLGTRMRSRQAKVLHQAGGMSMAELIVRQCLRISSPDRIHVITGHQAEQVEQVLAPFGVGYVRQTEQLGTGHAVLCAQAALGDKPGTLLIINGDCPLLRAETLRALLDAAGQPDTAGAILTTILEDPHGYGRVVRDENGALFAIVEEKAANAQQRQIREINTGIYAFAAESFWPALAQVTPDNPAREYYLTDVVSILHREGKRLLPCVVEDPREVLGVNNRLELATVDRILRERKATDLMLGGVTLEKPESITVDEAVQVGQDSVLEAFVQLRGATQIGENCRIGAGSILRNVRLGAGSVVQPYSVLEDTKAGEGVRVGPFSRTRGGAQLGAHVHLGNFVELKNTAMADGAKANHLAYLGDAEIGAKSNVGAGTITCNYDGIGKYRTAVGEGCFIGSNATLVAPLELGAGSYVAAGSVITHDVPADALAFGRARQANKDAGAEIVRKKARERKDSAKP